METTSYNSDPGSGFFEESGNILTLAEATWRVFSPFLSKYQWAFDDPSHSPRKTEIASAIINRGKEGCCTFRRPEGYTFKLKPLQDWAFEQAIKEKRKIYYVSYGRQALLYFDIDLHQEWQTQEDGEKAKRLIDALLHKFFGESVLFWNPSSRGVNGYLKVDFQGIEYAQANKVFDRLENALQRFLAFCESLVDFEIKGKVCFLGGDDDAYIWKQYGKLPIHSPDWSFARLGEFKTNRVVGIRRLEVLCREIERQVPQEVLDRHKALKNSKRHELKWDGDWFLVTPEMEEALVANLGEGWRFRFMCQGDNEATWLHRAYHRKGKTPEPMTKEELLDAIRERKQPQDHQPELPEVSSQLQSPQEQPVKAPKTPLKINIKLVDLASEPDSFVRQKEALFRYARYLKRVPTVEEGLQYIHDQNLFTGTWEENQARREIRVRDILNWIANTFDASKCATGLVNVGKFDAWAAKKFPKGLIGGKRSYLTTDGEFIDILQNIHVSPTFIAVFMAVAEFALLINKNQDNTVPHDRAEELWNALYAKGLFPVKFCARKWAVCREALVEYGIIRITNRDYYRGKAMEWGVGRFFPGLGLWKGTKLASLPVSIVRKKKTREQEHNTWLCLQPVESAVLNGWTLPRPPPGGNGL